MRRRVYNWWGRVVAAWWLVDMATKPPAPMVPQPAVHESRPAGMVAVLTVEDGVPHLVNGRGEAIALFFGRTYRFWGGDVVMARARR